MRIPGSRRAKKSQLSPEAAIVRAQVVDAVKRFQRPLVDDASEALLTEAFWPISDLASVSYFALMFNELLKNATNGRVSVICAESNRGKSLSEWLLTGVCFEIISARASKKLMYAPRNKIRKFWWAH